MQCVKISSTNSSTSLFQRCTFDNNKNRMTHLSEPNTKKMFRVKKASIEDAPLIVQLIRELADYEKLLHTCVTNQESLIASAFPPNGKSPLVYILIAHETITDAVAGFCLYFYNYSTFTGRPGLYLEDLFVREEYRGNGLGSIFFDQLKQVAREEKCSRMEWTVIDWNEKARNFYTKKIGAKEKTEWIINRLDEEDLL